MYMNLLSHTDTDAASFMILSPFFPPSPSLHFSPPPPAPPLQQKSNAVQSDHLTIQFSSDKTRRSSSLSTGHVAFLAETCADMIWMLQENNGLYGPGGNDPDNDMFDKVRGNGNMGIWGNGNMGIWGNTWNALH